MEIFKATFVLFLLPMLVHLTLWKIRLPKNQLRALLLIFAAFLVLWAIAAFVFSVPMVTVLHITLYYVSLSLSYVAFYAAIEVDSPTLTLVHFIEQAGPNGVSSEEAGRFLAERPFFGTRITNLLESGLIREENGRFVVIGKGSLAFRLILAYRKLYGPIAKGG
jgi:hypothetical protein